MTSPRRPPSFRRDQPGHPPLTGRPLRRAWNRHARDPEVRIRHDPPVSPARRDTVSRREQVSTGRTPPRQPPAAADGDRLAAHSARSAWRAVTPLIAGTPHVRVSRDGGRTYPARHARGLPADPPGQPCTVPVYSAGTGTGRVLALDFDLGRVPGAAGPAAGVTAQAAALADLVARAGGRVLADVAPGGGRHVFAVFATALPWRELRDLARAISLRYPAVDPAPMAGLGGQISPPGARHKSGGWRLLSRPLEEARAAAEDPCGPGVWEGLLTEFAAELQQVENQDAASAAAAGAG